MVVTGPQGYLKSLTTSEMLSGLHPGTYAITATEIALDGDRFTPSPGTQSIGVVSGSVPATASVSYQLVTGRLSVTITGLPSGVDAAVDVTGPGGYAHRVIASETLTGLAPGLYSVQAPAQVVHGDRYEVQTASQEAPVAPMQGSAAVIAVQYAIASGSLSLVVEGLPPGVAASVAVTGPQGFHADLTGSESIGGLPPGTYAITAGIVSAGGNVYLPSLTDQSVVVVPSLVPVVRTVSYTLATGSLGVGIAGLPASIPANVTISGPGGFLQHVTATENLSGLVPGLYAVSASSVSGSGTTYNPVPVTQNVSVPSGSSASAGVTYASVTGTLQLSMSGLPTGVAGNLTITGPGGFSQHFTATATLTGLLPGTYTIAAAAVTSGGATYQPAPAGQTVNVSGGSTAGAAVVYAVSTGRLTLTIGGLPAVPANVTVTGPGGFSQLLPASQSLTGLAPGAYTISAVAVVGGATVYTPAPPVQSAAVVAGATASASVTYTASLLTTLNLTIGAVYLTQATQRPDGSVPLVAGREAFLRVFGLANQANSAQPQVRVRLYHGTSLVQTYTIAAPAPSVPTAMNEGSLASSWNVLVPGALVQTNLKVLADIDPTSVTAEITPTDNQFPASGVPGVVDVRTLPVYQVRMIPVLQQVNGLQGNVTAGNVTSFLPDLLQELPVGFFNADVRAPYTTTAPVLQSDNANGAWGTILSEVLALRAGDVSTRYYYGVVRANYGSGVAGIGYVGGSARTALGWDYLPSGSGVMAHETGHNMSRQHAPCGGVAGPDPSYPYAGGKIGMWGLDVSTLTPKSPATYADLMGYCSPSWVSDYNWAAMVAYRQGGPNNTPAAEPTGSGLLVWGRITDTGVVLEPAFRVASAAGRAPSPGPNRLELLAADGSVLRSVAFEADEVADLPSGTERHFAFVVPLDQLLERDLAGLRLRAGSLAAARLAALASADPQPTMVRANAQQVDLRWDARQYPMVMVRDADTGDILSFARSGSARLWARGSNFILSFSDGVKSVTRPARILK
jgi:hypothetical protein